MAQIVLVMHEPLGAAFADCAAHIFGTPPSMTVFDVAPDASVEESVDELVGILRQTSDASLILCDLYGATPFNIAKRALKRIAEDGMPGHLVTGTNLCMVLKALTDQKENPEELSERVRVGALRGIIDAEQLT